MAVRTTTIASVSEQLEHLATYTDSEIESTGVYELRSVLRNLGIHSIERNRVPVPIRASRKQELVEAVKTLAGKQRELAKAVIPADDGTVPEVDLPTAKAIYSELKRLANVSGNEAAKAITQLANKVVVAQALAYPDTTEQKRHNVRCSAKTRLFRAVRELLYSDLDYSEAVNNNFVIWRKQVLEFSSNDTQLKRSEGQAKVDAKEANAGNLPVYLGDLLTWAERKLERTSTGLNKTEWKNVAIALALVTGRRCNEILCNLTTYEIQEDGRLYVRGLSKGKDGEMPELEDVTTLVDAELVLAGLQWLKKNGKQVVATGDETEATLRDTVNKRYSKELGQQLKQTLAALNVVPELTKSHTFHALRKFYIMECIRDFSGDKARGKEAARLLGHRDWATASDNYISEFTLVDEPNW